MNLWMFKQKINDIDGTENITERFELFRVWVENTYVGYQKSWELEEQETMMNAISEKGFWDRICIWRCRKTGKVSVMICLFIYIIVWGGSWILQ